MEGEMTVGEFAAELRRGARAVLQVRHAERPKIDHDDPTFGDRLPITEAGMATALKFGAMLAEFRADVTFVSSPLRRTRMTAAAIAEGMGVRSPVIPVDELLGNGSFYYDDPLIVLKVFKERDFFEACCEYYATGSLPGFRPLAASADRCERWLLERLERRLLIASPTTATSRRCSPRAARFRSSPARTGRVSSIPPRSSSIPTARAATRSYAPAFPTASAALQSKPRAANMV